MSESQGRGRARGRGVRGQQQQLQTTGRAVTRTPVPPTGGGGGAPPPGFRPQQQQTPALQQTSSGRAAHRGAGGAAAGEPSGAQSLHSKFSSLSVQGASASGDNGAQIGRGSYRGRRPIGEPNTDYLRTRPASCVTKQGTYGDPIQLRANYFRILTEPDYTLYQYRVDMAPEEDRTGVRRGLLRVHQNSIGPGYIFDGTVLYTTRRLSPDPLQLFSRRETDDVNIQITIRLVGDIRHGDYHYLQIYNIIIRKCLRQLDLQLLNRNYYDPRARKTITEYQLELWPGYITSMRQHDGGIMLCTEIVHKVLRLDTAYHVLENSLKQDPSNFKKIFQAAIIGQVVLTRYGNCRTYRIDDVKFDASPLSSFDLKGTQTSYVDYYRTKYNLQISNTKQPMLVSMPKPREARSGRDGPIYLVPELCQMTGITDEMRANMNLMRALADQTRMGAEARQQKLLDFNQRFYSVPAICQELQNWNLKLDRQLVTFKARRLPPEKIVQGHDVIYTVENVDWTNNLRSNPLLSTGELDRWVVVTLRKFSRETQQFVDMVMKAAQGMNFRIHAPRIEDLNDDRPASVMEALDKILSREIPKLVMCVVSNNRADRYNAIKKRTNVDRAVPSQVICARTMNRKGAMSIATKVAIQLACKIGGAPWSVDLPLGGLMVIGYDVCHDSQVKGKSYGAMVASLNKPLSRYFSTVTAHTTGDEIFTDLALNIGKAIHSYKTINNKLPARIAIYRDGVGDGQINTVMTHEVEAVKSALTEIYQTEQVKMAFIIVTKRLNTRLFHGRDNPPAGTVVDDCVTHPEKYDFFLISQSVRQGSVSPTGYNIVYDTIGLDADKLQRLSYKLTHLYYNWSGTVRVPAPCQYAHKLAFLVGQNLHRTPNVELQNLLYFL